jgi:hypothetical protein
MVNWNIFSRFGMSYREKSGNPALIASIHCLDVKKRGVCVVCHRLRIMTTFCDSCRAGLPDFLVQHTKTGK